MGRPPAASTEGYGWLTSPHAVAEMASAKASALPGQPNQVQTQPSDRYATRHCNPCKLAGMDAGGGSGFSHEAPQAPSSQIHALPAEG